MKNRSVEYLNHHKRGSKDIKILKENRSSPQIKREEEFASEIASKDYFGGISTKKLVENGDKYITNKPNTKKNNKY